MAAYARAIGATAALRTNTGEAEQLPQDYADMIGWEQQVRAVADVYRALPPEDRGRTVLVAANYGEAGALDFFGPRYGLPRVVSPDRQLLVLRAGRAPRRVVVTTIGAHPPTWRRCSARFWRRGRIRSPWSVAEERDLLILVARKPTTHSATSVAVAGRDELIWRRSGSFLRF